MGKLLARVNSGLSLYVRALAWLHTAPRLDPKRHGNAAPPPVSRAEALRRSGQKPSLPPNPAPHMVNRLMEIGPIESNGMDRCPIGWREIDGWSRATGIRLSPWEARALRRLSTDYLNEARAAEDEHCPPPWIARAAVDPEANESQLRALLG